MTNLLPCPFCGAMPETKMSVDPEHDGIICPSTYQSTGKPHCPASYACVTAEQWNRRSSASEGGETGWQPISTAPRDGREVWVSVQGRYVAKAWLYVARGDYWEGDSKHPMPRQPDHWMPVAPRPSPAPAPGEAGEAGG